MKLEIINLQKCHPIDKKSIKKIVKCVLDTEQKDAVLNVVFVDNKRIQEINKTYLGHNYATDVLSFSYNDSCAENTMNGEIIISAEMASKVAQDHNGVFEGELALYLVHGMLHLIGYNDKCKKDAKVMHQREGEIIAKLGYHLPIPD